MANHPNRNKITTREQAVRHAMNVIQRSTDHQEVENDLANHSVFGPWIEAEAGDELAFTQSIVSEAEERLSDNMPGNYS